MHNLTLPLTFKLILSLSKYKFSLNCFRLCIVCVFIHFLFYSLFQTCSVLQQTWWPHGHRAHPSHPPVRQRERVESTLLRNRSTFSRGTIQLFWFVCSIIHEHQTAGWMLTPATARTLPVIVSVLTGRLQRTAETPCSFCPKPQQLPADRVNHRTDGSTRVSP